MNKYGWIVAAVLGFSLMGCGEKAQNAADQAGDKLAQGAETAGRVAENAVTTGKVRTAIETANDVKIDGLNVDTMNGTVTLKGKAADAKSKSTAEEIAKTQVGNDYKVKSELTVGS